MPKRVGSQSLARKTLIAPTPTPGRTNPERLSIAVPSSSMLRAISRITLTRSLIRTAHCVPYLSSEYESPNRVAYLRTSTLKSHRPIGHPFLGERAMNPRLLLYIPRQ
jgi:hypothetical protein